MAMSFDEAAQMLAEAGDRVAAIPVRETRALARQMRVDVLSDWPVATGASRRGFTVVDTQDGARLFNSVDHAFFVGDGLAHETLQKSERTKRRGIVGRIERDTTKALEG